MAMLEVNDIKVYYGSIHAIKGVSFEVNEGEIISLIGANGAGKTTILQTVSNLLHSKTGSIKFLDEEIHHLYNPNNQIFYRTYCMFQVVLRRPATCWQSQSLFS